MMNVFLQKIKILFLSVLLYAGVAYAGAPSVMTFQSKILSPSGTALEAASVNFRFTILDSAGTCVLYVEDYANMNMTGTQGVVAIPLGSGAKVYPPTATSLYEVFNNTTPSFNCQAGGTISPTSTDNRQVVMQFNDGSGWQTLPQMAINAVPFANYATRAESLGAYAANAYLRPATLPTCAAGQALNWDGSTFTCIVAGGGGGSTYTGVTSIANASGDITLAPAAGTGSIRVTSNTPSTSTTTGAVVITGGMGVSGAINAAGNISTSGGISSTGSILSTTSVFTPQLYGTSTDAGVIRIDGTSSAMKGNVLLASQGGNVGIGTTTPSYPLQVYANNANRFYVDSEGGTRVAIADTSGKKFTVQYSYADVFVADHHSIKLNAWGAGQPYVMSTGSNVSDFSILAGTSTPLIFGSNNTERARFAANGNFGIGTATPMYALSVSGDINVTGNFRVNGSVLSGGGGGSTLTGITNISNSSGDITLAPAVGTGAVQINSGTASTSPTTGALIVSGGIGVSGGIYTGGAISSGSSISATTSVYSPQLYGTSTSAGNIYIDGTSHPNFGNVLLAVSGGRVGIGTTTPAGLLDASVSDSLIYNENSITSIAPFVTTPQNNAAVLSVRNTSSTHYSASYLHMSARNGSGTYQNAYIGTNAWPGVYSPAIVFGHQTGANSYNERMRISYQGYLGVGTNGPTQRLDVNGAVVIRGTSTPAVSPSGQGTIYFDSTANAFRVSQNGGTYAPLGDFRADGTVPMSGQLVAATGTPAAPGIVFSGDLTTGFYRPSASTIGIATNGTQKILISASGDISMMNPGTFLRADAGGGFYENLIGLNSAQNQVQIANSGMIDTWTIGSTDTRQTGRMYTSGGYGAKTFSLDLNGANRMHVNTSGNVGLGTTTPAGKLDVVSEDSNYRLNMTLFRDDSIGAGFVGRKARGTTSTPAAVANGDGIVSLSARGFHSGGAFSTNTVGSFSILAAENFSATGNGTHAIISTTGVGSTAQATERVRVTSEGNVGIGTTTPSDKLYVNGAIRATASITSAYTSDTDLTIDFNDSNIVTTSASCGNVTLSNMKDGGSYTLIVTGTSSAVCNFTHAGVTSFKFSPVNGATDTSSNGETVYTFLKVGDKVYVSWITGMR